MTDTDDGGTWLTKAEIARVRAISIASVEKLIRRQRWRRQPGNDGRIRVLVPPDWLSPRYGNPQDSPLDQATNPWDVTPNEAADPPDQDAGPSPTPFHFQALAALEEAIAALREQAEAANAKTERAETRAEDLRIQIDELNAEMMAMRAEADRELAEERQRADRLGEQLDAGHRDLDAARAAAREAQEAAEALRQAEAERKARGLVARLRAAWRGE